MITLDYDTLMIKYPKKPYDYITITVHYGRKAYLIIMFQPYMSQSKMRGISGLTGIQCKNCDPGERSNETILFSFIHCLRFLIPQTRVHESIL